MTNHHLDIPQAHLPKISSLMFRWWRSYDHCGMSSSNPNFRYQLWNIFTMVCEVVDGDLSVRTIKDVSILNPLNRLWSSNSSIRFCRTSLWSGITLPLLPFELRLVRLMYSSTSPLELQTSFQLNWEISFDLRPLFTDNRKMVWFLRPFLFDRRCEDTISIWDLWSTFDYFPKPIISLQTDYHLIGNNYKIIG